MIYVCKACGHCDEDHTGFGQTYSCYLCESEDVVIGDHMEPSKELIVILFEEMAKLKDRVHDLESEVRILEDRE